VDSSKKLNYIFRRYPLFRVLILAVIIGAIIGSIILINFRNKPVPEIESIVPPVGVPGDVIIISGKNFGEVRDMSYVEFSGTKLTASAYISWSDTKIKLVLPANIQDGLVVVGTKDLRSKPSLFSNEVDIPVPVPTVHQSSKPIITELVGSKLAAGDLLVIEGNNFGDVRGNSKVLFTIDYDERIDSAEIVGTNLLTDHLLKASEYEDAYEYWSNTEIKVRIPDGAHSGVVVVDTGKETSEPFKYELTSSGKKLYSARKIYLMNYSADIAEVYTNDVSTITLRCPLPVENAAQPELQITETSPAPILMNYQNNLIHQLSKSKNYIPKTVFNQTFVLPVYEISTEKTTDKLVAYREGDNPYADKALNPDNLVPSDNEEIITLAASIAGKERNPYKKAKLIYDYMCDNFKIQEKNRKNDSEPLELLKRKRGDAYDFAVIYTALLRAGGIPALTDGGILVLQDMVTQSHWWCEFYIKGWGWIPVDPALGAGLECKKWVEGEPVEDRIYYFGNMDSHHIMFSRGWNELKPFSQDNKIVQQPRSFALQSIWEESSSSTVKYSSYWSVPVIKGVY